MLVVSRRRKETVGSAGARVDGRVGTVIGPHDTAVLRKPPRMVDRVDPAHAPGQHIPTGFIPAIIFTRCLRQRTGAENEDCRKSSSRADDEDAKPDQKEKPRPEGR